MHTESMKKFVKQLNYSFNLRIYVLVMDGYVERHKAFDEVKCSLLLNKKIPYSKEFLAYILKCMIFDTGTLI